MCVRLWWAAADGCQNEPAAPGWLCRRHTRNARGPPLLSVSSYLITVPPSRHAPPAAHLTDRMHAAASTGLRFHRRNGRSVEYAIPSVRLPASVASSGGDPAATPMASAAAPVAATTPRAVPKLQSPAASGR